MGQSLTVCVFMQQPLLPVICPGLVFLRKESHVGVKVESVDREMGLKCESTTLISHKALTAT